MAIKTGIDILTRAVDLTRAGINSAIGNLRRMGGAAKDTQKEMSEVGQVLAIGRGGAVVAGIRILTQELEGAVERIRQFGDQAASVNVTALETTRSWAESIPVLGSIVASGASIAENAIEFGQGTEAAARAAHAADVAYEQMANAVRASEEASRDLLETEANRIASLEDEVRILQAIYGLDANRADEVRRRIQGTIALRELEKQQAQEILALEARHGQIAEQTLRRIRERQAEELEFLAQKLRMEELVRQEAEQLELEKERLEQEEQRRRSLEEGLDALRRRLTDDALSEEERRRRDIEDEIQRLRKEGLSYEEEQRLRQLQEEQEQRLQGEQLAKELQKRAKDEELRAERLAAAADRLPGIRESRGITGLAEAFRARRGANADVVTALGGHTQLLRQIVDNLKRLNDDQPRTVTF